MWNRWARGVLWVLTLGTAALIFWFSAQSGTDSSALSGKLTHLALRVIRHFAGDWYGALSQAQRLRLEDVLGFLIRKLAHFSEFAALSFFIQLLRASYGKARPIFWSWAAGAAYAATDELHQMFVELRSPMLRDVCIDSAGALMGVLAAMLLCALFRPLTRRRSVQKS